MALLWMDGFDALGVHNGSIDPLLKSSGYVGAKGLFTNQTRSGRGFAVNFDWNSDTGEARNLTRAFDTREQVIVGFAFHYNLISSITRVVELRYDNLAGEVAMQMYLDVTASGVIVAKQAGTANIICQSPPNTIFPGVWNYVELKVSAGRPGLVVIRLNGATVATGNGHTVAANKPLYYNMVRFPQYQLEDASFHSKSIDDFYLCDTSGSMFNDFCGDVVIHSLIPLQDAGPNQMASYGAGLANYTAVDDVPPDDDLSYLYSNTLGHTDMFALDDLPANIIDVLAVSVHTRARKDAAGTSNIKVKCSYLTDTADSPPMTLSTVYMAKHHIFETAPDGGGWNRAKANNMHIGVEVA